VLAAEQIAPHLREWSPFTDRQSLNDLGHGILQSQIGERVGAFLLPILAAAGASLLHPLAHDGLWPHGWPMGLQILLGVAVADGLDYWKHRWLHTESGWRFHALHHGITRLHALRSARAHVVETVMRFVVVYVPLVAAGAPHEVLFWHASMIAILGVLGHSNVDVALASPVHRILMTPHVHRLHHSNERAVCDTNFANVFPLWDVLFGTFSHPDRHALRGVGVVGDAMPASFAGQLLSPFTLRRDASAP